MSDNGVTVSLSKEDRIRTTGSRGNQTKWYKDGFWYKADFLGYEGLSEHICSLLLGSSNIQNFVTYTPIKINEIDSNNSFVGCMSADFGTFVTGEIILLHLPEEYNVFLNPNGSLEKDLSVLCEGIMEVFQVDILKELTMMLQFDLIVGNEDRILRNFGLKQVEDQYSFAPMFDHGLSLLANTATVDRYEDIEDIIYHPFNYERARGDGLSTLKLAPLVIDHKRFESDIKNIPVYSKQLVDTVIGILRQSLEETEGKLWVRL